MRISRSGSGLAPNFDDAGSVVRVTVTPAALFAVYLLLRSTLDAVEIRSYNSRNNLIALAVFGAVAGRFWRSTWRVRCSASPGRSRRE